MNQFALLHDWLIGIDNAQGSLNVEYNRSCYSCSEDIIGRQVLCCLHVVSEVECTYGFDRMTFRGSTSHWPIKTRLESKAAAATLRL